MYTTKNFKTKKALKEAVARWKECQVKGKVLNPNTYTDEEGHGCYSPITIFAPGLGTPVQNGWDTVEGPHSPEPHKWYARVRLVDGIVVEVK